jgi:hypothetical protein
MQADFLVVEYFEFGITSAECGVLPSFASPQRKCSNPLLARGRKGGDKMSSGDVYRDAVSDCLTIFRLTQGKETKMKLRILVTAVGIMLAASNAFAFHCPKEMKKIDDALAAKPNITAAQLAEVKSLRAEGETLHKQGKHQESLDTLGKAEKILSIQ